MALSHGPPARVLSPLFFHAKCLLCPKPRGKREHPKASRSQISPKPHGPKKHPAWLLHLGLNPSTNCPLEHHFQPLPQSVTPADIPIFFQLYWAAIVSTGRCNSMVWSQSSASLQAFMQVLYPEGVASQLHHGLRLLPSPWLKAWPQLFKISMKPVNGYRYVK